jgi:hypothetical protein
MFTCTWASSEERAHPDPMLTPGAVVSTDPNVACRWDKTPRFGGSASLKISMEKSVFSAYGIPYSQHSDFELDHFYPRCFGGVDTADNLWPQPCTVWGRYSCKVGQAADKDHDEDRICREICVSHALSLEEGKAELDAKWR